MAKPEPRPHTILVTGATDGIGLWLAKSYAGRGHKVLATGRQAIADDAAFFGASNIAYVRADQSAPDEAATRIAAAMAGLGWQQLDLGILNAGLGWAGDPADEPVAEIERQIAVNFTANVLITKALAPWLFIGKGRLAIIGSTAHTGAKGFATYAATKAAMAGFAKSLRSEWQGRAEVTLVHPGPTRTSMHHKAGLSLGAVRAMFMSTKRAGKSIEKSIRKGDDTRKLSRTFGWRSAMSNPKEFQL
ncbi:SDR family oxidoreductase [Ahrensia sp. R2A130]|uniref:SDR family NAD(P)-dependent oxidoreductase n=1 Tax=Ahrensia sp. R2A130 TaxID=744979 RepID=UPI0001E0946F|nr:SDR family NAD(P)-dependent oxidoreductase [Ahrensia sp. R2A130]EFL88556.1 oxidoreductase, short chain dehydrogenase [Ahrensia sp. R2A130]